MEIKNSVKFMGSFGAFVLLLANLVGCAGNEIVDPGVESTESALTTTYQAESAFDIDEGVVENIHAGYTGSGYLNINNFSNTFAWYIVNAPAAGTVSVKVRYANGASANRPIRVSANGGGGATIAGAPTGSWSTWVTATVSLTLLAGNNDVFLSSVTSDGMPNIDKFDIVQTFTRTFQAEAAFDIEEGVVENIHPGYTGSGYLNIENFADTFAWYIVNSPAAATVSVKVRYANGTNSNRPIGVSAGGGGSASIPGIPTGSWSTWKTVAVSIAIGSGDNDLFLSSVVPAGMPNIDKFDITW